MAARQDSTAPPELQRLWEVNNRLTQARGDLRSTTATLHAEQKALARANAQLAEKDTQLSELQAELQEQIQARDDDAQAAAQRLAELQQEIDSQESKGEIATVRIAELERDLRLENERAAAAVARGDEASEETARLAASHAEQLEALAEDTRKHELALQSELLARDNSSAALAARVSELEEEHATELQNLKNAHAVAGKKVEGQNAARVAEVKAAMEQSVATMERETATMAAKHDEEIANLQARVEQGDSEVSRFRTAHDRVAEEQSSAAAQLQAALAEKEALSEINKAALMKDRTALMQTHSEEIARMETMWREQLVQVELKWRQQLAAIESAGKAALRDREAKHAERIAALQTEFAAHNTDVESALRSCSQNSWNPVSVRHTPQAHVVQKCALEVSAVRSELAALRDLVVAFQSDWMKLLPRAKHRLVKKIRLLQQPTVAEPEPSPAMVYSPVSPM